MNISRVIPHVKEHQKLTRMTYFQVFQTNLERLKKAKTTIHAFSTLFPGLKACFWYQTDKNDIAELRKENHVQNCVIRNFPK